MTGASDGIGKETARQLAEKGVRVILGSRNLEKGQGVADAFKQKGLEVEIVQLDVTSDESVKNAAIEIDRRHGRLDILVNNAGTALDRGPVNEMPLADFIETYTTNVFGTFRVTQLFLPLLRRSAHGRIVNVSSGLGSLLHMTDENSPYNSIALPAYASSKSALNAMTIHIARELESTLRGSWRIPVSRSMPFARADRHALRAGARCAARRNRRGNPGSLCSDR